MDTYEKKYKTSSCCFFCDNTKNKTLNSFKSGYYVASVKAIDLQHLGNTCVLFTL